MANLTKADAARQFAPPLNEVLLQLQFCRANMGFQALLKVNLRLATIGYLSNAYNDL